MDRDSAERGRLARRMPGRLPPGRRFAIGAAALVAAAIVLLIARPAPVERWLGDVLVGPLETRFDRAVVDDWSAITGLVVLGGTPTRLPEALRLASAHPHLRLVLSGLTEDELRPLTMVAGGLGTRVAIEQDSDGHGTWGNAVHSTRTARPRPGERWLLVTSALHMPRAMGAFRAAGFTVEAWPVMDTSHYPPARIRMAVHEWGGLVAYRLRGRSSALVPGP